MYEKNNTGHIQFYIYKNLDDVKKILQFIIKTGKEESHVFFFLLI